MTDRPLFVNDLYALYRVVDAATRTARVRFLSPSGQEVNGTARSIGQQNGNFDFHADVRDLYLRVTMDTGFEWFIPVEQAVKEVKEGAFAID